MLRRFAAFTLSAAFLAAAPSAYAHHAFSAEFDANAPIRVEGKVVKVDWINPHAWVHVETEQEDGKALIWELEAGTPNTLIRRGPDQNAADARHRSDGARLPEQRPALRPELQGQRARHHLSRRPQPVHGLLRDGRAGGRGRPPERSNRP